MRHLRKLLTWLHDTRAAKWLHHRRHGFELLWHVTCAVMALLAIVLPTPRMIAVLVGCGVLLLIEQGRQLKTLHRKAEERPAVRIGGDVEIAKGEVAVTPPVMTDVEVIISVAQGDSDAHR